MSRADALRPLAVCDWFEYCDANPVSASAGPEAASASTSAQIDGRIAMGSPYGLRC